MGQRQGSGISSRRADTAYFWTWGCWKVRGPLGQGRGPHVLQDRNPLEIQGAGEDGMSSRAFPRAFSFSDSMTVPPGSSRPTTIAASSECSSSCTENQLQK